MTATKIETIHEWNGLKRMDTFLVRGSHDDGTYLFGALRRNAHGVEWVDCWEPEGVKRDGTSRGGAFRSFDVAYCHPMGAKVKRKRKARDLKGVNDHDHDDVPNPIVTTSAPDRICRTCDTVLVPTGKRGRPAVYCTSCKDAMLAAPKAPSERKARTPRTPKAPKVVADRICATCDTVLIPTGKRGRPAVQCPACKDSNVPMPKRAKV
jgi:DNA-directed RNA polymerase subunit M/transcription elongation factor TFIIS